jgi:hypothetical protein
LSGRVLILTQQKGFGSPRSRSPARNREASDDSVAPARAAADVPGKLSAANLEALLLQSKQFAPDSRPQCQRAAVSWDYVCSYMPRASQSTDRLQFGVKVDATRWVKVSAIVPAGVRVPAPE